MVGGAERARAGGDKAHGVDWRPWLEHPAEAAAITDYDGTLAPIVDDRAQAKPLPGVRQVLGRLSCRMAVVAVVSGRPVDYMVAHLGGVEQLRLVGLYGLERYECGQRRVSEAALEWEDVVSVAARAAQEEVPAGLEVELKGLAFALHARRRPELFAWARAWADERAAMTGLVSQPGRLSVELLPPVSTDKGKVVEQLATGAAAVCFFGDDIGDLPAFAALRRLRTAGKQAISVGVASAEQPEALAGAVDLLVDGPERALDILRHLAGA
ncbi:MAG: trehalose-phosphatase [Acidimicrobiales bacterium]